MDFVKNVVSRFLFTCLGLVNWIIIFEIIFQCCQLFSVLPGIAVGISIVSVLYFLIVPIVFLCFALEKEVGNLFLKEWAAKILDLEWYRYSDICTLFKEAVRICLYNIFYPILFIYGCILFVVGFMGYIMIGRWPKINSFFEVGADNVFPEFISFDVGWLYDILVIYLFFRVLGWMIDYKYFHNISITSTDFYWKLFIISMALFVIIWLTLQRGKIKNKIKEKKEIISDAIAAARKNYCKKVFLKN